MWIAFHGLLITAQPVWRTYRQWDHMNSIGILDEPLASFNASPGPVTRCPFHKSDGSLNWPTQKRQSMGKG